MPTACLARYLVEKVQFISPVTVVPSLEGCAWTCVVDVSGLEEPGDEVEILGAHQRLRTATAAGTISYEVLTGIGPRVPRLYIKD